ncbi:MAG: hypothetical protein KAG53_04215 [Endozoicomonadaceae bacterium]|nr:hypothetical protein [Endozoicomonadaceae bacterium]
MQNSVTAQQTKTASNLSEALKQDIEKLSGKSKASISKSEALRIARTIWPQIFRVSEPVPMKIGIHKEMIATNLIPTIIIKIALHYFVGQDRYLEALKEGVTRIDINGNYASKVSQREAVGAEISLYRKQQKALTGNACDNREFVGRFKIKQ